MTSFKRVQRRRVGLIFGLALIFSIGLLHSTYAEEAIIFRKGEGPNAFGYAVDVSDDTLIVGAPTKENGEVYIFARQGDARSVLMEIPLPLELGQFLTILMISQPVQAWSISISVKERTLC